MSPDSDPAVAKDRVEGFRREGKGRDLKGEEKMAMICELECGRN